MKFWEELMSLHSFKHLNQHSEANYASVSTYHSPTLSGFWHLIVSILSSDIIKIVRMWEIYPY